MDLLSLIYLTKLAQTSFNFAAVLVHDVLSKSMDE